MTYYLVYPDTNESAVAIQKHISDYRYTVPALRDPKHVLVKLARARATPEAAIFSARGELLYHGRIDNRYIPFGKARNRPTRQGLEEALQAALAGLPIKEVVTPAIGCSLDDRSARRTSRGISSEAPRILRCRGWDCHRTRTEYGLGT